MGALTFAVVIPLYNHERYIGDAIDSVLQQTRPVNEIIVVDDGSTDRGYELVVARLSHDPRARICRQKNAGAHVALNRGISTAHSKYISVLNSDDCLSPDKIARAERLYEEHPTLELIFGQVRLIDELGRLVSDGPTVDWLRRAHDYYDRCGNLQLSLLHENFAVTTSNMVFTKETWRVNGGFQPLRYCHDLDFLMAIGRSNGLYYDRAEHISYRTHSSNTIKEAIQHVRLEIAAVMTNTLFESGHSLAPARAAPPQLAALAELIRTKGLADLSLMMAAIRGRCANRSEFYSEVLNGEQRDLFLRVLAGDEIRACATQPRSRPGGDESSAPFGTETRRARLSPTLAVAIEVGSFDKGGLEKVVLDSAIVFRERGMTPIIVSAGHVGHLGRVAAAHGVEVLQLPRSGRSVFYRELMKVRHIRLTMSHFSRAGYPIFKELGIPNITFIHNVYAMLAGTALENFKADDEHVTAYISVSQKATRYASFKLGISPKKIVTIPNGLILEEHRLRDEVAGAMDRSQFGLQEDHYVFLNVASYNLHKAHYLMAQALELASKRNENIRLLCVGNEVFPPHVQQLREHIRKKGLEDFMIMPGYFPDVAPLHKMADAFMLPSFIEGWSIAMNEAMYYSKPLILSDTGGASEVIRDEDIGIIVPNEYGDVLNLDSKLLDDLAYSPRDYQTAPQLAEAMLRMAQEPDKWESAGSLARTKVVENYDFTRTMNRYIEVIAQTAEN